MSLMMFAALAGRTGASAPSTSTHTQTFTTNATFNVPAGVSLMDSLAGYGAAGEPGDPGTPDTTTTKNVTHAITHLIRKDGGSDDVSQGYTDGWPPGGNSYCDPAIVYADGDSTVYYGEQTCYYPETQTTTIPGNPPTAPTTGAAATAFGKVFYGGTGGAPSTTTYTNVPVSGGASYSIVVPPGGSITITYRA